MATQVPATDATDNLWTSIGEDFLFAEDEALKSYLKGMTVSDDKNSHRDVGVWFAMPDMEVRDQRFPFFVLELIGINEARDREVRGLLNMTNDPGATTAYASGTTRWAESPVPYNLLYQASAYSRHPRHNRQIIKQMLTSRVPGRLVGLPIAGDGSRRHMELLSWASRDVVENGRKLWQTVFTIQVTSETSDVFTTSTNPDATSVDVTVDPPFTGQVPPP